MIVTLSVHNWFGARLWRSVRGDESGMEQRTVACVKGLVPTQEIIPTVRGCQ